MSNPAITLDIAEGIAWLTLARPEKRNSVDPAFASCLHELAERCAQDHQIRCVVLTGSGKFFCVGGDIDAFSAAGEDAEAAVGALARGFHAGIHRLATMEKPLVTAINGPAAGAGLSLAILGDIALAAASAHFTSAYSAVGLTPDGGASWWLPRLVGMRRAQEMILTNRRIGAEEAATIGLVTRVVPDDALRAEASNTAAMLAKGPIRALPDVALCWWNRQLLTFPPSWSAKPPRLPGPPARPKGGKESPPFWRSDRRASYSRRLVDKARRKPHECRSHVGMSAPLS